MTSLTEQINTARLVKRNGDLLALVIDGKEVGILNNGLDFLGDKENTAVQHIMGKISLLKPINPGPYISHRHQGARMMQRGFRDIYYIESKFVCDTVQSVKEGMRLDNGISVDDFWILFEKYRKEIIENYKRNKSKKEEDKNKPTFFQRLFGY